MPQYGLHRSQRVKGKKRVETLFASGRSGFSHPFRYVFTVRDAASAPTAADAPSAKAQSPAKTPGRPPVKAGVALLASVPKRNHKRAVMRNRLKRRTREAFRMLKGPLGAAAEERSLGVDIALLYVGKEEHDFKTIEHAVRKILGDIQKSI